MVRQIRVNLLKSKRKVIFIFIFVLLILIIFISLLITFLYIDLPNKKSPNNKTETQTLGIQTIVTDQNIPTPTLTPTATPSISRKSEIKLGVVISDYKNQNNSLTDLNSRISNEIDTISIFKQFGSEFNKNFNSSDLNYAKNNNMKVLVAWEPWNPTDGSNQSIDYLSKITSGEYDSYIRNFANEIKSYSSPVIIRFGHEMNGDWYPWGKRPREYISAYKYIYDIFKNENVSNVKWMWSVNVSNNPQELSNYYPGNQYVDIIGMDGFNFGSSRDYGGWVSFGKIFGSTYSFLIHNYSKPIIVSETASSEHGGNKALWIKDMINDIRTKYVKIDEIIWFNLNKETDWRLESTDSSLNSFNSNF